MQAIHSSHRTLKFDSGLVTYVLSYLLLYILNTNLIHEESCSLTVLHSERPNKVQAGTPQTITQVILTQKPADSRRAESCGIMEDSMRGGNDCSVFETEAMAIRAEQNHLLF
jgi:hypothetical protein